jgi:CLIP-associating protein 1/2
MNSLKSSPPRLAAASAAQSSPLAGAVGSPEGTPSAIPEITSHSQAVTPSKLPLKVFEDPFTEEEAAAPKPSFTGPVLEDKPINEDAAVLQRSNGYAGAEPEVVAAVPESPEKARQNSRLLDSGITKIKAKTLEVHGFRKLQSLIRDSKTLFTDEKFEALLLGLFQYLEDPLESLAPNKAQDVKAQILATVKLLLKKERDNFQPYVSKGLECLLQTRSAYDSRAHIVSALELLADDLVTLGDGSEMVVVLTRRLGTCSDTTTDGCRMLSMGLHVLKEMLDKRTELNPTEGELAQLATLSGRCLDSADSGVRMDAVQLCVALHSRVPETVFWDALQGVKDDPKSLITYYIVKKQREQSVGK